MAVWRRFKGWRSRGRISLRTKFFMHVRTGPEPHSTPPTVGKFSCKEVKRPGRGGGGHSSLSSVEVASGVEGYFSLPIAPGEALYL
jgi:hypothetical protein